MKQRIPSIDEFIYEQKTNEGITHLQVLSDEFGGYDDKEFLYKAWRMTLDELIDLLSTAVKDLAWCKKNSKGITGLFTKRDGLIVKNRIAYIEQIIKAKNKNGEDYITDLYKDKTNEGQSLSFLQDDTYKFIGRENDWHALTNILNTPEYKKLVNDISYGDMLVSFEEDTDITFIPINLRKNLIKTE